MPEPLPYIREGDWDAVQQQTDQLNRFLVGMGGDNILSVPHCIVRRNAAQSLTNNAETVIAWDTEISDPHNMIIPTSTTVRVPFSGIWHIYVQVSISITIGPGAAWTYRGVVQINGSNTTNSAGWNLLGAATITPFVYLEDCSMPMKLVAGDTVGVTVFQNSGNNMNTSTTNGFYPMMAVSFLGNYS